MVITRNAGCVLLLASLHSLSTKDIGFHLSKAARGLIKPPLESADSAHVYLSHAELITYHGGVQSSFIHSRPNSQWHFLCPFSPIRIKKSPPCWIDRGHEKRELIGVCSQLSDELLSRNQTQFITSNTGCDPRYSAFLQTPMSSVFQPPSNRQREKAGLLGKVMMGNGMMVLGTTLVILHDRRHIH